MLYKKGKETHQKIPGYDIEVQYQLDDYYFLVTSYDCMFEEQCDFLLLDKHYRVIAKKSLIPWYYSSWNLNSHEYRGNNEFIFTFYKDYHLQVILNPNKSHFWQKRIRLKRLKN